jgi:hypothetical protein
MVAVAGGIVFAADTIDIAAATTGRPVVKLVQQAGSSQTGLATATDAAITFGSGSEEIDTHNWHDVSTNNTRITIGTGWGGVYRVDIKIIMAFSTTITSINACLRKNGSNLERSGNTKPNATANVNVAATPLSTLVTLAAGDYIEAVTTFVASANQATNNSAGSTCTFQLEFVRF